MSNCKGYTKLFRINRKILQEISSLLMLRIGKFSTVIYIHTATLMLSVHAMQMQQALEEERESFSMYSEVYFKCRVWDYAAFSITP